MVSLIADQLQLQDGSCLLTSGPQSTTVPAALMSGPQSTTALTAGTKSTTAALTAGTKSTTAALTTTAGSTTLKTGIGASASLGSGTIAGAILGILVIGLVAYGVNKAVRVYIK